MEYPVSVAITVQGPRVQVYRFLALCRVIDRLCSWGSTRTVSIDVDGDGPGSVRLTYDTSWDEFVDPIVDKINTDRDPVRVPGINDY